MAAKNQDDNGTLWLLLKIEEETRKRVSHGLSSIEVAASTWDLMKDKPRAKIYKKKMDSLKATHDILSAWMKKSLKGAKKYNTVVKRLDEFSQICKKMRTSRGK